jgi:hypothetical protein
LRRVSLSTPDGERARAISLYARWLLKSTEPTRDLFALFYTTCTFGHNPMTRKCAVVSMTMCIEPCVGLIFAVFHVLNPFHDTVRVQSGNVEIWAKMVSPADFSETRACIAPFAYKEWCS